MGAAAAPVAGIASIASIGLSAFSAHEKGVGAKAAADYKAQQLEREAQWGDLKAVQTGAALREQLAQRLGLIDSVRSAANTDPTSPTGAQVRDWSENLAERQRFIQVGSIMEQSDQDRRDADYARAQGKYALGLSDLDVASTLLGGAAKTNWSNFGVGT